MSARVVLVCLLAAGPALGQGAGGQGFAGLGADAPEFALPDPDTRLTFPRDHGPHPEFRIEWWYLTANLSGPDGTDYGIQWTLFRSALAPRAEEGWDSPQLWMAHAGLTTPDTHFSAERFARDGIGQAGVTADPFAAWIDDWRMAATDAAEQDTLGRLHLTARGDTFAFDLRAVAEGPLVLHGQDGFSVKATSGQASHYYSQPFYRIEGTLTLPEGAIPVSGTGWLDREWSSQPLDGEQTGWDWFALTFDDGGRMMAAQVRSDGDAFTLGTMIASDGTARALPDGALRFTPLGTASVAGREVPVRWRIEGAGVDVTTEPVNPQSWMDTSFAYWEGPILVTGSHPGRGYLEMTGY
jgi:predicted secreted hydrolase